MLREAVRGYLAAKTGIPADLVESKLTGRYMSMVDQSVTFTFDDGREVVVSARTMQDLKDGDW